MVICYSSNRKLTSINHNYNNMTATAGNNKIGGIYLPLIMCLQRKNFAKII